MSAYTAPLKDMKFVLNELAGMAEVAKLPGCEDATPDTVEAILEEAAKFTSGVLDPLNYSGDQEGCLNPPGLLNPRSIFFSRNQVLGCVCFIS